MHFWAGLDYLELFAAMLYVRPESAYRGTAGRNADSRLSQERLATFNARSRLASPGNERWKSPLGAQARINTPHQDSLTGFLRMLTSSYGTIFTRKNMLPHLSTSKYSG